MAKIAQATVYLNANIGDFQKAMRQGQREFKATVGNISNGAKNVGKGMIAVGGAVTASLGIMINKWADAGDQVQKMALRTGISTEALSEYKHALELSGTTLEAFETGIKKMQRSITEATEEQRKAAEQGKEATGTYTEALAMLNLTYKDLEGLSPEEQFDKIAMALADVTDKSRQAGIAQEIFGRAGTQLLPMLEAGSEGIRKMRDEAHELGIVFDQEAANKAAQFKDDLDRLKKSFAGIAYEVAPALVDSVISMMNGIRGVIMTVKEWADTNPVLFASLVKIAGIIGVSLTVGGTLLFGFGQVLTIGGKVYSLFKAMPIVIGGMTQAVAALGGATNILLYGAAGGAAAGGLYALYQMFQDLQNGGIGENWVSRLVDRFQILSKWVDKTFDGIYKIWEMIQNGDIGGLIKQGLIANAKMLTGPVAGMLIPGNANGTSNWRGGPTWVGERGPEIVNVPRGSQILSNADSMRMMGGMNQAQSPMNFHFYNTPSSFTEHDAFIVMQKAKRARARIA